jgi:hypothetical protein
VILLAIFVTVAAGYRPYVHHILLAGGIIPLRSLILVEMDVSSLPFPHRISAKDTCFGDLQVLLGLIAAVL